MSIKRFVAADMRRAMELVKQEMGPDAIILSSNRIKEGVEIVTSDDANYQSVADPRSLPSAFSKTTAKATVSKVPMKESFDRHLNSAMYQSDMRNNQAANLIHGQEELANRPLGSESESLLDKFRKKQSKTQILESESGLSAFEYYNGKAKNTVNINPSSNGSMFGSDFVAPFHLASMQYEPGNTNIYFDLDNTHLLSLKSNNQRTEIMDEKPDITEVDDFLDEQFGQLRSEILEMREMLQQQIETKSSPVVKRAAVSGSENKVTFMNGGDPLLKIITKRLKNLGLPDSEIKKCLSTIDISPLSKNKTKDVTNALDKIWSSVLADIAHRLTSVDSKIPQRMSATFNGVKKVSIFTGLSGAGKTDSIGKIATQHVLEEGAEGLVIISLEKNSVDLQKEKKLDRLSQILSVQHFIVSDVNDIASIVNHVKKGTRVLINLPSIMVDKKATADEMSEIITQLKFSLEGMSSNHNFIDMNTCIIVSASTPKIIIDAFFNDHVEGNDYTHQSDFLNVVDNCIVTQLDQLESFIENTFGCLLGCLLASNIPVSHISNGVNLPHYLQAAKGFQLVTTAVKLMKKSIQKKNVQLKNQLNVSRVGKIYSGKSIGKEVGRIQSETFSAAILNGKATGNGSKNHSPVAAPVAPRQQVAAP